MIRVFLLFLLLTPLAFGMKITDDPSFKGVYREKGNGEKIVLMIYTAESCPQCAYMKEKVFKEPGVKRYMDAHFVLLEKDVNRDELPEGFDYFGIPTLFFVDKNGAEIGKFIGSARAKPFLEELRKIVKGKE